MKALILTGGASAGADQIGRLKALTEAGYTWDFIIGISVGAINGFGLSTVGVEGTVNMWKNSVQSLASIQRIEWEWPWKSHGLLNFDPLQQVLTDLWVSSKQTIPMYAVCSKFSNAELVLRSMSDCVDHKEYISYVIASCCIAGLHRTPVYDHYDGGFLAYAPHDEAIARMATTIDIVGTVPKSEIVGANWSASSLFPAAQIALRGVDLSQSRIIMRDMKSNMSVRTRYWGPSKRINIGMLDYAGYKLSRIIDSAYRETLDQIESRNA